MSLPQRHVSRPITRLSARASPYHSAVTLYATGNAADQASTSMSSSLKPSKRIKLEVESKTLDISDHVTPSTNLRKTPRSLKLEETVSEEDSSPKVKAKSPKKPKPIPQFLDTPHPAPLRWKEAYDSIKAMREHIVAPVDTMGCDRANHNEEDPKNRRFSVLVSLMLSSQTKDEVTDAAVAKLRAAVGGTLSIVAIISADDSTISDAIAKVGFWRRKTGYIKKAAIRLRDDFDSDVPKTVDELCSLPGVGPKMAFLTLHVAWNLNHGIGVDVHVHRITNRLGWHQRPTKKPEETRLNLQSWLPIELHREINHMLVGFGQTICVPVGPKCDSCTLSTKGLCPSASTKTPRSPKKRKRQISADLEHESGPKIDIAIESSDL
ncbi:DNA glycosylase [Suillus clintonianus]|uniref:DNA glycosylase n=1 Tax=Suillus clintonianus TaxID=1904413 RepID=UPI001B877815|nr:DNA glycosylase [Suillus clintonianus]KAG2139055.1 DNA glycosylase [Suillus clintonianus]